MIEYDEASQADLETWDERTVLPAGGHVLQSRSWAEYRSRMGWLPRFLIGSDGSAALALVLPWPFIRGASAYIARGPIPNGTVDELVDRLDGVAMWLADHGVDVIVSDAEVAAWTGYPKRIAALGFKPVEEIEPSRHRLVLRLGDRPDEDAIFNNIGKSTRQRIRQAERQVVQVVRYDATIERDDVGPDFLGRDDAPEAALSRFHGLLARTGQGGSFAVGPRGSFLDWSWSAYRAGYLVLLEARDIDAAPLAGLVLYRHGGRLSIAFAGEVPDAGERYPGAFDVLRWRAIQLAARELCSELDLDAIDTPGARHEPQPGEPMHGLYQDLRSFGAEWLELAGAHERIVRPARTQAGRIAARAVGRRGRQSP